MSDMDTIPLHIEVDEGFQLPNSGKFTLHDRHVPDLMSGSKSEWERILRLLLAGWYLHEGDVSDMLVLHTIISIYGESVAHTVPLGKEVSPAFFFNSLGKVDCSKYHKDIKAVHFSHNSKDEAFLGGWLEDDVREKYGRKLNLTITNEEGEHVSRSENGEAYENLRGTVKMFEFHLHGAPPLLMREVYDKHRVRLVSNFIKDIKTQCV